MKIVYCLNSIRGLGGIQKVTVVKANALAEIPQNEVYVIVTDNWDSHQLILPLSPKVHFINLRINYYENDFKSKYYQILSNLKIFAHYIKLQRAISLISPDVIISVGQSEKYILPILRTKAVKIREIHFASTYRKYTYHSKLKANILDFIDYKIASRGYDKIVLLTKEDKDTYFPMDDKYIFIHNPLTTKRIQDIEKVNRLKTVISVGRLTHQKDYISLIRVWKNVYKEIKDWNLCILGEGSERKNIENEIIKNNLSDSIKLPGYSNQVATLMSQSSLLVLTSLFEGFPLVILEAMNLGLPIIAYTCQFGPRDIITNGKEGYLIENRDEQQMANRIIELIKDQEKRLQLSYNAMRRVEDFSVNKIMNQWMTLFRSEIFKHIRK